MARPPKEPKLRMNVDLRIPVTEDQKRIISAALADEPGGLAAWARSVLLDAAHERLQPSSPSRARVKGTKTKGNE